MEGRFNKKIISFVLLVVLLAELVVLGYFYYLFQKEVAQNAIALEAKISDLEDQNMFLADALYKEQQKNSEFASQIKQIAGTVGKLDILSKTDKELLQKYSKVYFLNENYIPEDLVNIPPDYVYEEGKKIKFHTKAFPYLQEMLVSAKRNGINLKIISGFRSFGEQGALKNAYLVTYGSGANQFSADQGFSEHQLGTTIDFTTPELGANFDNFKSSSAYDWLLSNAYKYGFVISYPEGNNYYQFEPWHWRFVGKGLAKRLYEDGEYFYDLDQRTIDSYLINIFN
ncbi:MAG: M15 family metallopeptidase [Parcubacteria group bacterium]|jgi:LAS superfamily LD-carboxypeptidase LdcB|nr:M15 family metallopeptidase [Parcubacteria group bacterium]